MSDVYFRVSYSLLYDVYVSEFLLSLSADNSGTGEWNMHCVDCVPLAKEAKKARMERPTSAKIRMILKLLNDIDVRSRGEEKTIIFSQFTSMLNLIEPFLKEKGIKYVRCECLFL